MTMLLDGISVFVANWQLIVGILVAIIISAIPFTSRFKLDPKPASTSISLTLALFFSISLLLRLAFVSNALFPSYFDSAAHYTLIKNIMSNDLSWIFDSISTNYYHMGFHFVVAFFASIFQTEISTVMLIFGQIILALLPLLFYFIVKRMTQSNWAGVFASTLSAFGWYMPAHAVDWGKYPALLSLYTIMFVVGSIALFLANKDKLQIEKRIFVLVVLGFNILFTAFVHSRSVIVLGVVLIAWVVSIWWGKLQVTIMHSLFVLLLFVLCLEVVFIQRNVVLQFLFDSYLNQGIWITSLIILLAIFAYKTYPQLTFINLITVSLLLVSLFISVKGLFSTREYLTLMDRPYVEMILFMPLSILGGLGLAGLGKGIRSPYQRYVMGSIVGLTLIYGVANHEFYPSNCCVIVGNDDVAAMAWMADQLPVDARIGVASTALKVVVDDAAEGDVGADAGIWVTPLTDRVSILLPNDLRFDQEHVLGNLCNKRISHIFIGEVGQPFDIMLLDSRPTWYRSLLLLPRTRVYEVIGCDI